MAKQEREADKYVKDKWYQNIWYHYKVQICIVVFLLIAAFAFIYSSVTKSNIDLYVLYITADPEVYRERVVALETALSFFAPDVTNDKKINVFVDNVYIGSNHETDAVYKNKERIMTNLRAGTCFLILTDETGLEYMISSDALCDLSEEFADFNSQHPEINLSGYFCDLKNTLFFEHDVLDGWDEENNLYMSLRRFKGTIAEMNTSSLNTFEHSKEVFENVVLDNMVN